MAGGDDDAGARPSDAAAADDAGAATGKREADAAAIVHALLERRSAGVLSTQSVARPGYPFGSGVQFALSHRRSPIMLLSDLAAHTRNLRAEPRACLFGADDGADVQAVTRASLLGRAAPLSAADAADARARYLARFPDAERTFALGGFLLWELVVEEARWIEGFGRMGWLAAAALG